MFKLLKAKVSSSSSHLQFMIVVGVKAVELIGPFIFPILINRASVEKPEVAVLERQEAFIFYEVLVLVKVILGLSIGWI